MARGLENLEFACGVPYLFRGAYSEQASTGVDVHSVAQPLGVVAGITPFNFPAMVPLWMMSNGIACGNCFILKPSEKDPSASLVLADLWKQAGLPDGVFNVIHGDRAAVDRILEHPDIAAVILRRFDSDRPPHLRDREPQRQAGAGPGGAKNHMVVLPDADVGVAADAAVSAGYGSAGERCMAVSAIVAVGAVADPLVEAIAARIPKVRIGPGDDPVGDGPARDRRTPRPGAGVPGRAGARRRRVGRGRPGPHPDRVRASSSGPAWWTRCSPAPRCTTTRSSARCCAVVRVDTYDEALRLVNSNRYANGVALFTRDGGAARRFEFDVEVGMVGINVPIPVPVSYYSFGGWKASLFGDTHMYGPDGIRFYTRTKVVTTRWPDPATSTVDLGFPQHR